MSKNNNPTRPKLSLVELADAYHRVEAALLSDAESSGGEIHPLFELFLDSIESDLEVRVDQYAYVLDRLKAESARLEADAKRLKAASDQLTHAAERIQERIMLSMDSLQATELRGINHRFRVQKNGVPSVEYPPAWIDEPPAEFTRIKKALDVKALKETLLQGQVIEGCSLRYGKHLRDYINKGDL